MTRHIATDLERAIGRNPVTCYAISDASPLRWRVDAEKGAFDGMDDDDAALAMAAQTRAALATVGIKRVAPVMDRWAGAWVTIVGGVTVVRQYIISTDEMRWFGVVQTGTSDAKPS